MNHRYKIRTRKETYDFLDATNRADAKAVNFKQGYSTIHKMLIFTRPFTVRVNVNGVKLYGV